MDRRTLLQRGLLAASVALVGAYGCERSNPYKLAGDTSAHDDCPPVTPVGQGNNGQGANTGQGGSGAGPQADPSELDERDLDYSEALRVASLKLVGNLPTLDQIYELADTADDAKAAKYAELVDAMFEDDRFEVRMINYWREVFKMYGAGLPIDDDNDAGTPPVAVPSRDFATVFAARMVVEGRPWTDLLTATADTCPTYDGVSFVSGDCNNGITPAGILTDPGIQSLFWGNLAFRRQRFIHETFLCRNANAPGGAEPTEQPSEIGPCGEGAPPPNYNSPWPMSSISGECSSGPVDFHEYNTTVVCANCHATWNHRAPLLANFDRFGQYMSSPQVLVPVEGSPFAVRTDWLPDSESTAWKFGMPAADLAELGQVMASDPEVIACGVKRMWNYAMSRGDIVDNETPVPDRVVETFVAGFEANDYNMRAVLRDILLSDDFVRF
jgi:hypothetical protein